MDHTLPHHRLPIKEFAHKRLVERAAEPLRELHTDKGQQFLVARVCHTSAKKAWDILRGIDRDPCGAPHHMLMPRGQNARCSNDIQDNTLGCAHGKHMRLQQALVAAAVLKAISHDVIGEYAGIRKIQQRTLLEADALLTSGYAIAARGKEDESSQNHLRRMGLPVIGVRTADVHGWMCGKQDATSAPLIVIIDKVIAGLQERFPALREECSLQS